ncbi:MULTISPECIES: hypothetical protein [Pseudomonas]|uniref:Uncharacterized protein n=1 Tax=Pseudomonas paralactis TaxID=1615673 RepID=A0A0R3AF17_9PSED|nr:MULTISPECIES: hypothetical protein [Pseudomonas]KRP71765.1 hypothetical protein TX23_16005 [Pseudomonas paralactis]MBC3258462.1 hypothetical protein [Pseudomonas paralactis]MBJ2218339.1 hypothetical protein [Pseudomonas sp. MF7453]
MKLSSSRYTEQAQDTGRPLVLSQRTSSPAQDSPMLFQESCLGLTADQDRIVLRRYFEHYSPDAGRWVEYAHSISTAELVHWIMTHGQLHVECSQDTANEQVAH